MSMIVHRCSCGHIDQFHVFDGCSYGACTTRLHSLGEPEVIPSWGPDGKPIEEIAPPGTRVQGYRPMCDCERCRALYASVA